MLSGWLAVDCSTLVDLPRQTHSLQLLRDELVMPRDQRMTLNGADDVLYCRQTLSGRTRIPVLFCSGNRTPTHTHNLYGYVAAVHTCNMHVYFIIMKSLCGFNCNSMFDVLLQGGQIGVLEESSEKIFAGSLSLATTPIHWRFNFYPDKVNLKNSV